MSTEDEPVISVRPEQPGDREGIRAIHRSAFPTDAEANLVDELRSAGRLILSLVAIADGGRSAERILGHIAFSPVTVAGSDAGLGLAPVAVAPDWQGRGIGSQLVRAGLDTCMDLHSRHGAPAFVVVLGEPAWYGRFGFAPASGWGLTDEYGGGDAFQALELRPGAIPANAGLVRYAPEFAVFG